MAAIAVTIGRRLTTRVIKSNIFIAQKQNNFLLKSFFVNELSSERYYRGSNRMKRLKEARLQTKLEKQLESEYGITKKVEFNFQEWLKQNYFKELCAFQNRLGVIFQDETLLASAFAHPSFCNEIGALTLLSNSEDGPGSLTPDIQYRIDISRNLSNLSLEKLSLLGFDKASVIIKEHLYNRYTNLTSSICNDVWKFLTSHEIITSLAKSIGLEDFLLFSRELDKLDGNFDSEFQLGFTKDDVLNDTLFALIGAIEVDLGHKETRSFVEDFILPHLDHIDLTQHVTMVDPHEELVKVLSINGVSSTVKARTLIETGVDSHFPFYQVGVYCRGIQIGEGSGHSASIARSNAFKNTVFQCLENDVDFNQLKRS